MSLKNLGSKVRGHRRSRAMTQVELARRLGISASYLNLIEQDKRPLTAALLIKLAREFDLDFDDFASESHDRLAADLMEVFADPIFEEHPLNSAEVRELAMQTPNLGRGMLDLYRAYTRARADAQGLASRIYDAQEVSGAGVGAGVSAGGGAGVSAATSGAGAESAANKVDSVGTGLPSETINDFIQQRLNHFPRLEEAAEAFVEEAGLRIGGRFNGMVEWLAARGISVHIGAVPGDEPGVVRRYDPARRRVDLSNTLPPHSRNFQLATTIGLIAHGPLIETLCDDPILTDDAARGLARVVLANYFAGAVLMPYTPFLAAAKACRYDTELLTHRFGVGFEQICHRLTSLRRPGEEGVPFHMIRVDVAGNISKRFSASGIRFARFAGACPRWNVFSAFQTPGRIQVQLSRMRDDEVFFCIARTIPKGRGGFHTPHSAQALGLGCKVEYARELIYSDGMELDALEGVQEVGVTCRLCDRAHCEQRVLPNLRARLTVDVNVRRGAFYTGGE